MMIKHLCNEAQARRALWANHLILITEIFFSVSAVVITFIGCVKAFYSTDCMFMIKKKNIKNEER